MKEKNCVVIFGGSFNPPLNSHLIMAQGVLNQYEEVEKVVFVPVNQKYPKDGLIENEHRYNMLKPIVDKNSDFIVSDLDFHENHSLYTIDVLEKMQKKFKGKQIWFLTGSDNLRTLHTWQRAEEIVSKYKIIVMKRKQDDIRSIIQNNNLLTHYKENIEELNPDVDFNISSTYVRAQIKKGKKIRYLLPDDVYKYIEENKLYK